MATEPRPGPSREGNGQRNYQNQNPSGSSTNSTESSPQYRQYMTEFYFIKETFNAKQLDKLREKALNGELRSSKFRSIYWMLFLGIFKEDEGSWTDQKTRQRTEYQNAKETIAPNPREDPKLEDNPLSQEENSKWHKHFCDTELRNVIKQDVLRAFPNIPFFRNKEIQYMMEDILFIYARLNPSLVYRQGMHEVLGLILFVVQSDYQAMLQVHTYANEVINEELDMLMNSNFFEHDAFEIFDKVMLHIEPFYQLDNIKPLSTGHFPNVSSADLPQTTIRNPNKEILQDLETIKQDILLKHDPELYDYLVFNEMPISLFGIKWLRLLFIREFVTEDILFVWDVIFAEGTDMKIIGPIATAMLMAVRQRMCTSDHSSALQMIMKYPGNIDVDKVIKHALHIKSPEIHRLPAGAPKVPKNYKSKVDRSSGLFTPGASKTLPRYKSQRHSFNQISSAQRVNGLRNQTAINALNSAAHRHSIDVNSAIVDGYRINDPDITALEYNHIHGLLVITRSKLDRYVQVLKRQFPNKTDDELHQVINGLEELCSLLKPLDNNVETALEANEVSSRDGHLKKMYLPQQEIPRPAHLGGKKDVELRPMKSCESLSLENTKNNTLPNIDPTNERDDSISSD